MDGCPHFGGEQVIVILVHLIKEGVQDKTLGMTTEGFGLDVSSRGFLGEVLVYGVCMTYELDLSGRRSVIAGVGDECNDNV